MFGVVPSPICRAADTIARPRPMVIRSLVMGTLARAQAGTDRFRRLLRWAALADLVLMAGLGLILKDASSVLFAGSFLVGLAFLRIRSGIAGVLMLAVILVDTAVFMVPAALSNLVNRDDLLAVMIPASVAIVSLTGAAAVLGSLRPGHEQSSGRVAALIPQVAIAVFALALIAGLAQQRDAAKQQARPGDLRVEVGAISFAPETITARAGSISIAARNTDLFWHTFTIDDLGVDLGTPVRATRRVTFQARSGTYRFYCKVPGHAAAGMEGTLRVQ